jgi:hypothetical protein
VAKPLAVSFDYCESDEGFGGADAPSACAAPASAGGVVSAAGFCASPEAGLVSPSEGAGVT